jgi:cell division protease FtsH
MDGFEENSGVIVIAATNRLDSLDPALLRAGRFDRKVRIDLPDMKGREQILKVHSKNKKMSPDIDYKILSQATTGMAGADIDNLLNEAALIAGRQEKESIDMVVIEEARDKILMGIERKNLVMKDEEKRKTAVHEAGHALITLLLPQLDRLHKVSIIPRGMALGVTQTTPEENLVSFNHEKAESYICMLMAGRAAEDIEFKHFSSGASDDLKRATMIARKMICEWGMSKKFGPISFNQSQNGFENNLISQQKMAEIDNEIQNMLTEMYEKTKDLLIKNNKSLVDIADLLMKKETCTGEEIKLLIG